MLPVPKVDDVSLAFGEIKHMPKYDTIPDEFKKFQGNLLRRCYFILVFLWREAPPKRH